MLTVVTAASSRRLTTILNARADLAITSNEVNDRLIDQATSAIESYCRRIFAQQTYRETLYGRLEYLAVVLSRSPATSIVSVTVDDIALTSDGYQLDDGLLYRMAPSGRVPWAASAVVVEYKAGYILPKGTPAGAEIALPAAVEMACVNEIAAILSRRSRDPLVRSEREEGVGSTDFQIMSGDGPLSHPDSPGLLAPYRQINL
jgi:hypothetical protein